MNTTILLPLRPEQVEVLLRHHEDAARKAATLPERADHLRDADDMQRRLTDHAERTEARA